ncbi:MAG TPA: hypothetical protein VFJ19_14825 [Nocardioidaceae bacterium]|nr:hypothetical protein [Nocardioidaceae bacterium]
MGDRLLDIAQELYSLPPAEFTDSRNAHAQEAGAAGDAELARRIKTLHKPSISAWAVNQLMRHHGEQMAQLLEMGAQLRQAHDELDADALRELTRQRRALTSAVTRQARRLGTELGVKVSESAATQIEQTLHAAMVDEQAAAAVRSGLMVQALTATGVDPVDVSAAIAVPEALGSTVRSGLPSRPPMERTGLKAVPDEDGAERDRRAREKAAQAAIAEAEANARLAETTLREAADQVATLEARGLQLAAELEEVRRRAAALEHEAENVEEELAEAEQDRDRAERTVASARQALEKARADWKALGSD